MNKVVVTLPLPPQANYPNSRTHWKAKMKPKKQQRTDAYYAALSRSPPKWNRATCQATFYLPRRRDSDNLLAWLKSSFDGLEDAGIIANDRGLIHLPVEQVTAKAANGRREVVITITSVE